MNNIAFWLSTPFLLYTGNKLFLFIKLQLTKKGAAFILYCWIGMLFLSAITFALYKFGFYWKGYKTGYCIVSLTFIFQIYFYWFGQKAFFNRNPYYMHFLMGISAIPGFIFLFYLVAPERKTIFAETATYRLEKDYKEFSFMARHSNTPLLYRKYGCVEKLCALQVPDSLHLLYASDSLHFRLLEKEKIIHAIHINKKFTNPFIIVIKE